MQNNVTIAITGGIGSGKSTALEIVKKWGYKSINADLTYAELLKDEDFVIKISSVFNIAPLIKDGKITLDKSTISNLVFNDKTSLTKLNDITHPAIMNKMLSEAKSSDGLVFCEVPLLYEGGFENLFDFVFVIMRNDNERINSAAQRDGKTFEQIKSVTKNQFNYTKIIPNEHTFIIENDGSVQNLTEKIKVAIEKIKK